MRCSHCGEEVPYAVCPLCQSPLKARQGLLIPQELTLAELPYAQARLYDRFYRIAVLLPDEKRPLKLCFGCEERPKIEKGDRRPWFNPIIITPSNYSIFATINAYQLSANLAVEGLWKGTGRALRLRELAEKCIVWSSIDGIAQEFYSKLIR